MISLRSLLLSLSFYFLFTHTAFTQEFFSCSGTGGFYGVFLINPNAADGDDGNLDGNCEYIFTTSIFTSLNAAVFAYVGTGTATPSSVTHTRVPFAPGSFTVLSPCGNLDIAFNITEINGSPICAIRNNLMPVELTYFKAKSMEKGIVLNWTTASETNNLGFDIERSTNGKTWKKVAFVEGHLTTLTAQHYEYIDVQAYEGQSYYRLKQMDTDGEYEYSEIITVQYQANSPDFSIFPNPSEDVITLALPEELKYEDVRITLFDNLGRMIKQEMIAGNELKISDLKNGIYLLVADVKQNRYAIRFVKK
ncbi:MAG: T9SS type A sorting domain-containing protein [Bacteroidota bacterium]